MLEIKLAFKSPGRNPTTTKEELQAWGRFDTKFGFPVKVKAAFWLELFDEELLYWTIVRNSECQASPEIKLFCP